MSAPPLRFQPSGDTGLTVRLGDQIDTETSARVAQLARAIDAAALPGVVETVPTYLSLLVHYDPLTQDQAALAEAIRALAEGLDQAPPPPARRWCFPVCFEDPEYAPDLSDIAARTGLSQAQVIEDLTTTEQRVYMIGFAPGQPYLGDLPARLALPRRSAPIPRVEAGSVLIATGKTVIYPTANPTGWHIVGRCPIPLVDWAAEDPFLLRAGDLMRFQPVSRAAHDALCARLSAGGFDPQEWRA